MATEAPLIEAKDLSVVIGRTTLVHVDAFQVFLGETHVLMGPNGAGKSTLLRAVSGLTKAEGSLWFSSTRNRSSHQTPESTERRRGTLSARRRQ